jgi:DNA-binding beta-propeller fold protein YncE
MIEYGIVMNRKPVFCAALAITVMYAPSSYAAAIQGWGVAGDKLFQLGFDSNPATTAATRSLYATLPDSSVTSMALSPDGSSLFAVSGANNTVYKVDLNTATTTSIGQMPTSFDLTGASTRGNEILLLNNGALPAVWSLNMNDASLSTQVFSTTETTSIGGRASSMVSLNNDLMLFFNDEHNSSSFRRRAWTMANDGTTTLLGTVVDSLGNEVRNFNASDMAADGLVYAMDAGRGIWEIDYAGAQGGLVQATRVDAFTADGISAYGWSSVVFAPASIVPVPATVWLFGSGLLGLVAVARRK